MFTGFSCFLWPKTMFSASEYFVFFLGKSYFLPQKTLFSAVENDKYRVFCLL